MHVPVVPYWRLSGLYFGYFTFIGGFAPYFSLYLQSLGQPALEIGILLSLMQLTRIGAPYFWASLADRRGWRVGLLRATMLAGLCVFAALPLARDFTALFAVLAVFAFFSSATMPVLEAVTLTALRARIDRYASIRSWGSVGFIAAVLAIGWALDRVAIANLAWMLAASLAATLALALTLREAAPPVREPPGALGPVLARPEVVALLAANVLMNVAHGPLYAFYSIHLATAGYDKTTIGILWSLGVIAEIAVFMGARGWLRRFAAVDVLMASFALAVARFVAIGWWVDSLGVLVIAQLLHAASFGACHLASMALVAHWFTGTRQVRGQALYLSVAFGLGGFVGAIASGAAWEAVGPAWTFGGAAIAAGLGLLVLAARARLLRRAAPSSREAPDAL